MCSPTNAELIEIGPSIAGSDCVEEFEQIANRLEPGDTLVLRGGRYEQSCRRAVSIQGTEELPITIKAAEGDKPLLTRPDSNQNTENNLELIDSRYLIIQGLEFAGGSTGVRLMGETSHFELSHSTIRNTGNNAFAANTGNSAQLHLHHNTLHTTGQSAGNTEGEGFYLGCHDGSCSVSNSRIEHNTLYNLHSSSSGGNDGIEIKPGSGGNLVRHNFITGQNDSRGFPCILAYGSGIDVNIIENNQLTRCTVGIYVSQDAIVRGNLVTDAVTSAIVVRGHESVGAPSNVAVVNNTTRSSGPGAGLHLALWRATDITVFNNAIFSGSGPAVKGSWLNRAHFATNWVYGRLRGVPLRRQGFIVEDMRLPLDDADFSSDHVLKRFQESATKTPLAVGSTDINGTQRPQGTATDIGAFEHLNPR